MLASFPASMLNQNLSDLGILKRFNLASSRSRDALSQLGVLAPVLQEKLIPITEQHEMALVEGLKRGAVTDRDDGGCRQFLLEETIERGFRGFIERGRGFIEEQILRRVQQRACQPKPLLLAQGENSVPVRVFLQLRRELGQAHRDKDALDSIVIERARFPGIDGRSLQRTNWQIRPLAL